VPQDSVPSGYGRNVGQLLRLRISLSNRAGALGQAATIVGLHGGNILSIDVHRTVGDMAVDDVVVQFSEEPDLHELGHDLATNAATSLMVYEATNAIDPVVESLNWIGRLLGAAVDDQTATLVSSIAQICWSSVAWVSNIDEAIRYESGRRALENNTPVALRTTDVPERLTGWPFGEVTLLAVPDLERVLESRVIFVAKPGTTDFTETEIVRTQALAALENQIEELVRRSNVPSTRPS
jgi:hypothetical protein